MPWGPGHPTRPQTLFPGCSERLWTRPGHPPSPTPEGLLTPAQPSGPRQACAPPGSHSSPSSLPSEVAGGLPSNLTAVGPLPGSDSSAPKEMLGHPSRSQGPKILPSPPSILGTTLPDHLQLPAPSPAAPAQTHCIPAPLWDPSYPWLSQFIADVD